jgi:hypothetical protein
MATPGEPRPAGTEPDALDVLLRARGLRQYGVFLTSGEGKLLPDGSESESGYVVDASGAVYFYWLDWDPASSAPVLKVWERVESKAEWATQHEYHLARQRAGLQVTAPR